MDDIRIDKWLWAVRIFKTRSQASEACRKGKVIIGDVEVKASRSVKIGEIVLVKKLPVLYTFKVKELLKNRVGAKLVENYMENLTSEDEMAKLKINKENFFVRDKGAGRPTKKERRLIDDVNSKNKLF